MMMMKTTMTMTMTMMTITSASVRRVAGIIMLLPPTRSEIWNSKSRLRQNKEKATITRITVKDGIDTKIYADGHPLLLHYSSGHGSQRSVKPGLLNKALCMQRLRSTVSDISNLKWQFNGIDCQNLSFLLKWSRKKAEKYFTSAPSASEAVPHLP